MNICAPLTSLHSNQTLSSPLLQRSLWACGSVCRSPWQSYWRFLHPSRVSETAATAHKADPYLELREGTNKAVFPSGAPHYVSCEDHLPDKTHCCFPSCKSKDLFPPHCEQTCNFQCTGTSCQPLHACKSKKKSLMSFAGDSVQWDSINNHWVNTLTSNWDGIGFLIGSGLTVVHFFLSWELTSTTRLSFAQLRQR